MTVKYNDSSLTVQDLAMQLLFQMLRAFFYLENRCHTTLLDYETYYCQY